MMMQGKKKSGLSRLVRAVRVSRGARGLHKDKSADGRGRSPSPLPTPVRLRRDEIGDVLLPVGSSFVRGGNDGADGSGFGGECPESTPKKQQRGLSSMDFMNDDSFNEFLQFCGGDDPTDASSGGGGTASSAADGEIPTAAFVAPAAADVCHPVSTTGRCPFRHGTVYARPYPGYAHGYPRRGVCPAGCRPEVDMDITQRETARQTLVREATEFIDLYYHERADDMKGTPGFKGREERLADVMASIEDTGTYEHTFDEIQHGARVAWRNAPKCSNRKYWQNLKLIDCRSSATNKEMFDACLNHLSKAMACGSSEAYISVFRPAAPGTVDGPRIWNEQLLSYAAYEADGGKAGIVGDQKNLRFTQMLEERFGWKGPPDGQRGRFDYLPLVIQADPRGEPELFELPLDCAPAVQIFHPRHPELSALEMQWYPIPAVCALDMSLGGLLYTAVPFNGWYADTEVLRDLVDEGRYNLIVPIARALGLETDLKPGEPPYYKDDVLSILCKAIYHSFKSAKVAMIDHHNLIDMFWDWYRDEMMSRKYCPVNWKWVIPPKSSSTNRAYLGLSKAQEYTLKPAYIVGKSFVQLENEKFGKRCLERPFENLFVCMIFGIQVKKWVKEIRSRKQKTVIIYASVTGNSAKYASEMGSILNSCCDITFFDACGVNATQDKIIMPLIRDSKLAIFVTSTQGNGEIPSLSEKFFSLLFGPNGGILKGKETAVLGFGSSAYPIFCGGARSISNLLDERGAIQVVPRGECDAVKGEHQTFSNFVTSLIDELASRPDAGPKLLELSHSIKDRRNVIQDNRRKILEAVGVRVFSKDECKEAIGDLYVNKRNSGMTTLSTASLRRSLSPVNLRSSPTSMDGSSHSHNECKEAIGDFYVNQQNFSMSNLSTSVVSTTSLKTSLTSMDGSSHSQSSENRGLGSSFTKRQSFEKLESIQLRDIMVASGHQNGGVGDLDLGNNVFKGEVISRQELITRSSPKCGEEAERGTSLIKIDMRFNGNPPYQPGDHVHVYPHNTICQERLESFVKKLTRSLTLDDRVFITLGEDEELNTEDLELRMPLLSSKLNKLVHVRDFFETEVAIDAPVSAEACSDLALVANDEGEKLALQKLGSDDEGYERAVRLHGLAWIDLFKNFPSLSNNVGIEFLLCSMKKNHVRSYSIASCKSVVGRELHLVVGRFLYSRGSGKDKEIKVGVCSNYLTSIEAGDEIMFEIESKRSFHLPPNPTCPLILVCAGTGFAPIRGLLQKRIHLKSRGEKLGPAFLVFGQRSSSERFFQDELNEFREHGALNKVWVCYSRELGAKEYTSDKIRSPRVRKLLGSTLADPNTHIFICGSANLAEQTKEALRDISCNECVDALDRDGRIHCDVFGALSSK